jgi:hypothetical protein
VAPERRLFQQVPRQTARRDGSWHSAAREALVLTPPNKHKQHRGVLTLASAPKGLGGARQKGKGKEQSNARRAEAADGGGLGTPSRVQLQELFAAFMLTQNAATVGPRGEDSYSGSVIGLKVPVTPISDTNQT